MRRLISSFPCCSVCVFSWGLTPLAHFVRTSVNYPATAPFFSLVLPLAMADAAPTPRVAAFRRILADLQAATEDVNRSHAQLRADMQTMRDLETDHRSASDRRNYGLSTGADAAADEDDARRAEFMRRKMRVQANETRHKEAAEARLAVIDKLSLELPLFRESDWMFVASYLASKGAPVPEARESQLASLKHFPGIVEGLLEGLLQRP